MGKNSYKPVGAVDPTLPFTEISIDGKIYRMCFNYDALANGEALLNAKGFEVNILGAMLKRTFSSVRVLFAVSLMAYHPDVDPTAAQSWVTHENLAEVLLAIEKAWAKNVPAVKDGSSPPQPAQ